MSVRQVQRLKRAEYWYTVSTERTTELEHRKSKGRGSDMMLDSHTTGCAKPGGQDKGTYIEVMAIVSTYWKEIECSHSNQEKTDKIKLLLMSKRRGTIQ